MNSLLADLLNAMLLSGVITACVWYILRFAGHSWNAHTREAVWWLALLATVMVPLLPFVSSSVHHLQSRFTAMPVRVRSDGAPFGEVPSSGTKVLEGRFPDLGVFGEIPSARVEWTKVAEARFRDLVLPIRIPAGWWASLIVVVWLLASLTMLVRLVVSYIRLNRMKARAIEAPPELVGKVHTWMNSFQKHRRVRVLISTEIATPIASGPHRPAILIPQTFNEIESAELDQICLHEVAHLGRRDDYWLAVQRIVQALFVLHPVVGWITARIRLEREIACDDFVVNMTGEPRAYALCLVRMAELSVGATRIEVAAPIANGRSQLENRINLLLNEPRNRGRLLLKINLTGVLAVLAALLIMVPRFLVSAATQPEKITVTGPVMVTDYLVHVSPRGRDTGLAASVLDRLFFMPTEVPVVPLIRFQMPAREIGWRNLTGSTDGWIAEVSVNGEQRAICIHRENLFWERDRYPLAFIANGKLKETELSGFVQTLGDACDTSAFPSSAGTDPF